MSSKTKSHHWILVEQTDSPVPSRQIATSLKAADSVVRYSPFCDARNPNGELRVVLNDEPRDANAYLCSRRARARQGMAGER